MMLLPLFWTPTWREQRHQQQDGSAAITDQIDSSARPAAVWGKAADSCAMPQPPYVHPVLPSLSWGQPGLRRVARYCWV